LPEGIGLQFMNDTDLTTIEGYLNAN